CMPRTSSEAWTTPMEVNQKETDSVQRMAISSGVLKKLAAKGLTAASAPAITTPRTKLTQKRLDRSLSEIASLWMIAVPVPRSRKFRMNTISRLAIPITPYALGPNRRATVATDATESTCLPAVDRVDHAVPETAFWVRPDGESVAILGSVLKCREVSGH